MPSEGAAVRVNRRSGCTLRPFRLLRKGEIQQRLNVAVKSPVCCWDAARAGRTRAARGPARAAHLVLMTNNETARQRIERFVRRADARLRRSRRGHQRGFRRGKPRPRFSARRPSGTRGSRRNKFRRPLRSTLRSDTAPAEDQAGEAQGHGQGVGARMSIVTAAAHHLRERAPSARHNGVCAHCARACHRLTRDTVHGGLLCGRQYGARRHTLRHSHGISLRGARLGSAQRRARWRRTGRVVTVSLLSNLPGYFPDTQCQPHMA